ncbi:FAD-dependent oxidoreductase [Acidovorax sp. SDU_ACID1]|uniref:FAD-dependent oxidoreductase n=1 Tax=Acidovorax sp. SDU_ACID1 TaxID=3136632 RepID=UPI0038730DD7
MQTYPDLISTPFDVLVAGAGVTGICAALAAARQGARTVLLEPRPFIGGNAATGLCIHTYKTREGRQVVYGLAQEIVDRLIEQGGAVGHVPLPSGYVHSVTPVDADLFRMETTAMLARAGVTILYNTALVDAVSHNGQVEKVLICSKSELGFIRARTFVDATGDADLAVKAGAPARTGWPGGGAMQPVSMMMRAVSVDTRRACEALSEFEPAWATKRGCAQPIPVYFHGTFSRWNEELRKLGIYDHDDHQFWTNTVWPDQLNINGSRLAHIDGSDPLALSRATVELTAQLQKLGAFMRDNVPGFENASFLPNAFVGVRETRNIQGLYELNEDDIRVGRRFDDTIGQGCFPVDIHHPDGKSQEHIDIGGDGAYDIPYRCLVPQGIHNLLVAGRCISVTPYAHGATRNMAPCMTTGEAAGVAAAMCAAQSVPTHELAIGTLQGALRDAKVFLGEELAGAA